MPPTIYPTCFAAPFLFLSVADRQHGARRLCCPCHALPCPALSLQWLRPPATDTVPRSSPPCLPRYQGCCFLNQNLDLKWSSYGVMTMCGVLSQHLHGVSVAADWPCGAPGRQAWPVRSALPLLTVTVTCAPYCTVVCGCRATLVLLCTAAWHRGQGAVTEIVRCRPEMDPMLL